MYLHGYHDQFSPKCSQQTVNSAPTRAMYVYCVLTIGSLYVIYYCNLSCCIEPRLDLFNRLFIPETNWSSKIHISCAMCVEASLKWPIWDRDVSVACIPKRHGRRSALSQSQHIFQIKNTLLLTKRLTLKSDLSWCQLCLHWWLRSLS